MWLFTRRSLSTPVICKEDIGPVASLRRSSELVWGRFWFVLVTATRAFFSEEAVRHAAALTTGSITGSHTWGEWIGASIVAALVIPQPPLQPRLLIRGSRSLRG